MWITGLDRLEKRYWPREFVCTRWEAIVQRVSFTFASLSLAVRLCSLTDVSLLGRLGRCAVPIVGVGGRAVVPAQ